MNVFNNIKLATKLPIIMIGLTILTISIASFISFRNASDALMTEAEEAMQTVAEARALEMQAWLDGIDIDLRSQADNPTVLSAIRGFEEAWQGLGTDQTAYLHKWYIDENSHETGKKHHLAFAEDGSAYSQVHKLYHNYFRQLVDEKGYYDVFLFDAHGDLIYSVFKERDYATNFLDGPFAQSGLGAVVDDALSTSDATVSFSDFAPYEPSAGAPAAFIAAPVSDQSGKIVGVIAFQMPTDRIEVITTRRTGLGETGDSYLVGRDFFLRSNPIHGSGDEILKGRVETESVKRALAGKSGVLVEPDAQNPSERQLSAYTTLSHHGEVWALITEQTIGEIVQPANRLAQKMLVEGLIMTLVVAIVAFLIARSISRPLTKVETAMRSVSEGDYAINVPGVSRGDEIGQIAHALDDFRHALGAAEQATSDGLFKGAAFEGSSAALVMINKEFEITYMNEASLALFEDKESEFKSVYKEFEASKIIGKNIDIFHKEPEHIRAIISDPSNMPFQTDIKVGETYFQLVVNSVIDLEGHPIGNVMEWKDVTDLRTNEAVIFALDTNQAKVEFHTDGRILEVNENFSKMLGLQAEQLVGVAHDEIFKFDPKLAKDRGKVWDRLLAGETIVGRFKLHDKSGKESILEGTFSPVKDARNTTFRIVLLGSDITQSQHALAAAEQEQAEMKRKQDEVVDALRVSLKSLAAGDLTTKIETAFSEEYETLRCDFNDAIENLLGAMSSVVENAGMIRGEAAEISNAADDLSRRTEKQAATLEQTATALDQLTSSVRSAADGAHQASGMVDEAKSHAEASGKVVKEAVEAMGEIENSSNQISKITSVIDDIAFQTNLLALNAGVEAARAGDAGRGFAVVASEVRALAQRSSEAAREINNLISKSGSLVKRGVGLVGETGAALEGIVKSVSEVANNVMEIAASAGEQSSGLAEINTAVNQLDQVTQQNAAMFEETTAASHALTREAENLHQTTERFSIGDRRPVTTSAGDRVQHVPELTEVAKRQGVEDVAFSPELTPREAMVVNGSGVPEVIADDDEAGWEDF